jgi:predicted site-specific integrase-resolvase
MAATTKQLEEIAANMAGVSKAARVLEVNEATARRWADRGELPMVRMADGTRLFDMPTIQRIAAERAAAREAKRAEAR